MKLGQVVRCWTDISEPDKAFECREQCLATAECPRCGAEVPLLAETKAWGEAGRILRTGRTKWAHESYGPAAGEHCGLLIADWWEGTFCYEL